jgi:hypothetical protein
MIYYPVISFLVKIALHDDVHPFLNASPAYIGFTHMTELHYDSTALEKEVFLT